MRWRLTVLLAVAAAGCLWRGYGKIAAVHVDVLSQTATKLCDLAHTGSGPTAEGMAEYVYPAQRARTFLRQFDGYRERRSYQHLVALVDRYDALVGTVLMLQFADSVRTQGDQWSAALPRLESDCAAVQQLAGEVGADVQAGA